MKGEFHLTQELMEGAYEFLRQAPPFNTWPGMPEADEVEFHVLATPQKHGDCGIHTDGRIFIRISTALVGSTSSLLAVMAHEMIHGYQWIKPEKKTGRSNHDSFFNRAADKVCKFHHFDRKLF